MNLTRVCVVVTCAVSGVRSTHSMLFTMHESIMRLISEEGLKSHSFFFKSHRLDSFLFYFLLFYS